MVDRRAVRIALLAVLLTVAVPGPSAQAGIVRGLLLVLGGVIEVPRSIIAGTVSGPPIVGTLAGTVKGALRGAGLVIGGTLETAVGVAALAKRFAFLLPIFL